MSDESLIRCAGRSRSHAELRHRAALVAAGLKAADVGAGDRVALMLRNSVEFLEISAGIGLAGAHPVPVNWHWQGDELAYLLGDSGSRVLFVHTEFADTARAALSGGVRLIEVGDEVGEYESWLAAQTPLSEVAGGAGLGMIYTSGTTGKLKGIVRDEIPPEQLLKLAGMTLGRMGLAPGGRLFQLVEVRGQARDDVAPHPTRERLR